VRAAQTEDPETVPELEGMVNELEFLSKSNGAWMTPEVVERYLREGSWSNETWCDVLEQAARDAPDAVVRDDGEALDLRTFHRRVLALAGALRERGIKPGERVAVHLPSWNSLVAALFAVNYVGAVPLIVQTPFREREVRYAAELSEAVAYIGPGRYHAYDHQAMAQKLKADIPSLRLTIGVGPDAEQADLQLADLIREADGRYEVGDFADTRPHPGDPVMVMFTSGTTGRPKGVTLLHGNTLFCARAYSERLPMTTSGNVLIVAPISHLTGLGVGVMLSLYQRSGWTVVDLFTADRVLDLARTTSPEYLVGAPPHILHLLRRPELDDVDWSSLKAAVYAGAPIPEVKLREWVNRTGSWAMVFYGWTEGFAATMSSLDDPLDVVATTVGRPIPGVEFRLVDDTGHEVPDGEAGEVWARGPNFAAGYFMRPEATATAFTDDGWFRGNDVLVRQPDGNYRYLARADDIINRGGEKIDPRQVEEILVTHPKVQEVVVVGVPDPKLGERVCACVTPASEGGAALTLDELREHLSAHDMARFMWPEKLVLLDELPTTYSGKVQRYVLRERFVQTAV
jgi:acyl-CoA synthetase (AMP-forming)/AMP-acid ligase II